MLLKNDAGILPLADKTRTIALIGPLADAAGEMLGNWDAHGEPKNVVTLRAALEQYAGPKQMQVLYEKGCQIRDETDESIQAAVAAAKKSDVVLLAVGEAAGMTGEAASRTNIGLPGLQPKLFDAVAAAGKPIVLIVFSGRPLVLTPYVDKSRRDRAGVASGHPGRAGAAPRAQRQSDFSGRLTVSMARSLGPASALLQPPQHRPTAGRDGPDASAEDGRGKVPVPLHRRAEHAALPLRPRTVVHAVRVHQADAEHVHGQHKSINDGSQSIKVTAQIRNTGGRDGVEVVQLYINQRGTSVARPGARAQRFPARRAAPRRIARSRIYARQRRAVVLEPRDEADLRARDAHGVGDWRFSKRRRRPTPDQRVGRRAINSSNNARL